MKLSVYTQTAKARYWWWPPSRKKAKLVQQVLDVENRKRLRQELIKQGYDFSAPTPAQEVGNE